MKILLTASNTCTDPYPVYPLGMSVIAQALAAADKQQLPAVLQLQVISVFKLGEPGSHILVRFESCPETGHLPQALQIDRHQIFGSGRNEFQQFRGRRPKRSSGDSQHQQYARP